ncbi:MetQ/NlpA family ABC transporter substrate-binding protein [Mangrovicoccus algicola]|uniref:ABC transporter substrate-binding protein n=1 Tax=Mangrovicoccus algicola TaxID=2771008 RepID=A0A8J6Z8M8_9RHOB|nr:MetQ/NlpA family ABC transporter substrate-binding protein [Mangrovicoccus algicola]MBE3639939.1 ABC transporter substrate-binding protein [Mangrovicoccus algicola]
MTILRNSARFLAILALCASGTGPAAAAETIRLGVSFFPFHSADATRPDLLQAIAPDLQAAGYEVEKVVFLNYAEANPALAAGEIDGNLIQHRLYMDIFNRRAGADLAIAAPVYHATFALYSGTYDTLGAIPDGETVIIPGDGVNTARALMLLQAAGLIGLAPGVTHEARVADVTSNPKGLRFLELPLTAASGAYDEGGRRLAVMYPTFARALDLTGDAERLILEERGEITDAYAISLAVRAGDLDSPATRALAEALQSGAAAQWLRQNYAWASAPAR